MRQLFLLLIGLFVGATCAFLLARGLGQRDAYARGVMNVMQHHVGELRRAERAGRCAPDQVGAHFDRLAGLSHDVFEALQGDAASEPHLADAANGLIKASDAARNAADCPAVGRAVQSINEACEACHREYR